MIDTPARRRASILRLRLPDGYDWSAMIDHHTARAIPGVEHVDECGRYRRTANLCQRTGIVSVEQRGSCMLVTLSPTLREIAPEVRRRVARLFDTELSDHIAKNHLRRDPVLARIVDREPGLRLPGAWDPFEMGVRAILGQQVSVAAARTLAGRLVERYGQPLSNDRADQPLTNLFPQAADLHRKRLAIGLPRTRARTLRAFAEVALRDPLMLTDGSFERRRVRLAAIPGVGPWTSEYIALRVFGDRDAFPATDLGLLRGFQRLTRTTVTAADLQRRAECWRPWRAYAAQYLWRATALA